MWFEFKQHRLAYLALSLGLVLGVFTFLGVWPNRVQWRLLSVVFASFYIAWGALTHLKKERLTRKILFEYIGIGGIGMAILWLIA
jgi:hypothetical protein